MSDESQVCDTPINEFIFQIRPSSREIGFRHQQAHPSDAWAAIALPLPSSCHVAALARCGPLARRLSSPRLSRQPKPAGGTSEALQHGPRVRCLGGETRAGPTRSGRVRRLALLTMPDGRPPRALTTACSCRTQPRLVDSPRPARPTRTRLKEDMRRSRQSSFPADPVHQKPFILYARCLPPGSRSVRSC